MNIDENYTNTYCRHSRSIEKGNNCLDTIKLKNLAFYEKEKKASKEKKSMKKSSSNRDLHLKNEKAHQSQPKLVFYQKVHQSEYIL